MENLDYQPRGGIMDRKITKLLTKMEKRFLSSVGIKMGLNMNVHGKRQ